MQRFDSKVHKTPICHIWRGCTDRSGYGMFSIDGRTVGAHRVAYELYVGPIPSGMCCHHVCHNRACVRPSHLRLLSRSENSKIQMKRRPRRDCLRGHPLTVANTLTSSTGKRRCRTCQRELNRRWMARHRAVSMTFDNHDDAALRRHVDRWQQTDTAAVSTGEKAKRDALEEWERRKAAGRPPAAQDNEQ